MLPVSDIIAVAIACNVCRHAYSHVHVFSQQSLPSHVAPKPSIMALDGMMKASICSTNCLMM
ncbi:MAG: hypothetical protein ACRC1D_09895 [Culicoidibacterales bacterium]